MLGVCMGVHVSFIHRGRMSLHGLCFFTCNGFFFSQEQLVGNRAMPTTGKVAQELLEDSISARRWVRSLMEGLPAGADAASTQALQPKLP